MNRVLFDLAAIKHKLSSLNSMVTKPGRRSNPVPEPPAEEEGDQPAEKDPSKKKKKKSHYEVTC